MTSSLDNFDRLIQSIDRIDTIRSQSAQIEQALGSADRDKVLVEKLLATYEEQGIALERSVVEKAVAQTLPTKALVIPEPGHPIAHTLARAWLNRTAWIKPLAVGSGLAASALLMVLTVSLVGDRLDARSLAAATADTMELQQQAKDYLDTASAVEIVWPVQGDLVAMATTSLQQAQTDLKQAESLARESGDADDLHEPIASLNEKAEGAMFDAFDDLVLARKVPSYARQLEQVREQVTNGTNWPQLDEVINARLAQAQAMLSDPRSVSGLPAAVSELNTMASAGALRGALQEAAKTVPSDGADQAASLVASGETALLRGQGAVANQALDQLRDLTRLGAASYTLRITNDPNDRTGVWRHPNDNPNVRNHYIVVDAVDAAGNPVQVPVVNEEDGSRHTVSRFAVRVPERVYNQVGADKTDNGLVDNNVFGSKKPGTLETQYAFDVEGGMITNW